MDQQRFVDTVRKRAALDTDDQARRAIAATLGALAQCLSPFEAQALADELPPAIGDPLRHERGGCDLRLDEFYDVVARRESVAPGFAREHAQVVLQALGEALAPSPYKLLLRHLPATISTLFQPRAPSPELIVVERVSRRRNTLSDGRPGSMRTLSEWHADRAQSESVVRAANPHERTKLSSAEGLTQERLHETLATGRPGTDRPLGGR